MLAYVLGALLLGTPPALQGDAAVYYRAALGMHSRLEYERALEQLGKARRASVRPVDDAAIAVLEGVVQMELNRKDEARAAFELAHQLSADAALPVEVAPKVRELFESVRANAVSRAARTPPLPPSASPATEPSSAHEARPDTLPQRVIEPARLPPRLTNEPPSPKSEVRWVAPIARPPPSAAWLPLPFAGATAALAVAAQVVAASDYSTLTTARPLTLEQGRALAREGSMWQAIGWVAVAATAALMLGSLVWWLIKPHGES